MHNLLLETQKFAANILSEQQVLPITQTGITGFPTWSDDMYYLTGQLQHPFLTSSAGQCHQLPV